MRRDEMVQLVEQIVGCDGTEAEIDAKIMLSEKSTVCPDVIDLMFHHEPELTAEEVVDAILAYKPIQLPGPDD